MERYSKILAAGLFVFAMCVGYFVSRAVGDSVPTYSRMITVMVGGLLMAALDLLVRRLWGDGEGARRYLIARNGPSAGMGLPLWALGILLALVGLGMRD